MPLNYNRNYKAERRRRKLITTSVIIGVLVLVAAALVYLKFVDDSISWNPFRNQNTQIADNRQNSPSGRGGKNQSGEHGLALTRQPIFLYTVDVARASLPEINKEYVKVDTRVDDSYFDDALFIGDSRTEGFMM